MENDFLTEFPFSVTCLLLFRYFIHSFVYSFPFLCYNNVSVVARR